MDAIRFELIEKSFSGRRVLRGVSGEVPFGEVTAVTGPSGCGKTTLARILLGLEAPDAGRIIGAQGLRRAAAFQEDRLIASMSARGNLSLVLRGPDGGQIADCLRALGLKAEDKRRVALYSGGMARRVALARALIVKPQLLVLDEPFNGLDEEIRARAAEFVLSRMDGAAVLLITHDPEEMQLLRASRRISLA